jgi:NAD(P)-dependent dehydrogenase (short-subunit alcohol dehydrogenase family)
MTTATAQLFALTDKVAVVTGGAGGIGAGITKVLAEAGATVVVADCDRATAEQHVSELIDNGHRALTVTLDLADEESVVAGAAEVIDRVGTPWLLVNNAALQDRQYLVETTASDWDRIFAVNARGAFLMTREIARAMISGGQGGRIVNIASNAVRGGVVKGLAAYASSKGALTALSMMSAFEFAEHRITVNTVLPGAVVTPGAINAMGPLTDGPATRQTPFGFQEPDEIGAAVLFFASAAARPITNQVLAVDGGFSIS